MVWSSFQETYNPYRQLRSPFKIEVGMSATLGLRIKETTLGLGSKETTKDAIPRPPEVRSSACSCSCKSVVTEIWRV